MSDRASQELIAKLERLGLAKPTHVARMSGRVRRLARDLPVFDSVWIDALAQARVLTPFQAAEWNAGRSDSLRIGPYVLCDRLPHPLYVPCYRARNVETQAFVRLALVEKYDGRLAANIDRLRQSAPYQSSPSPLSPALIPPSFAQNASLAPHHSPLFVAEPWHDGRTAADWIAHHGRLPSTVALYIAQTIAAQLGEHQANQRLHTDLSVYSLLLTDSGNVHLMLPGLRGVLRPEEGYAHADLPPEAFDGLAPERVAQGTPPNVASEIYACGCLWWQLLCGRPPLAGGDAVAKLRAAQIGNICDPRRYVADVPEPLRAAIEACLKPNPAERPTSLAQLASLLGPPTAEGREAMVDCLSRAARPTVQWSVTVRRVRKSSRTPLWLAGATCVLATLVALWPMWRGANGPISAKSSTVRISSPKQSAKKVTPAASTQKMIRTSVAQPREAQRVPDRRVTQASYTVIDSRPEDIVLQADKPIELATLALHDNQRVCAADDHRAVVYVSAGGLLVDRNNVRFENIDFVWRSSINARESERPAAILQLLAGQAEFRCCSFIQTGTSDNNLAAVRWIHPTSRDASATSLPCGSVRFIDCIFRGELIGIDCQTIGAVRIDFANSLQLGSRPLVRLDHCPAADEMLALSVAQCTLRGGALLECGRAASEARPGQIAITATASVFAPRGDQPLVQLLGMENPASALAALQWTGQGSLVTPQTPIVNWKASDGRQQTVDEASLSVAGLVRSDVRFAGSDETPAANEAIDWQAPLQSNSPPGINPETLPPGESRHS